MTNQSHTILVVDDNPTDRKLITSLLDANGFGVMVADEAPVGLEMAMNDKPDLILLDVMMPIINGFNICRLIKTQPEHQHIPIILVTSRITEEDRKIGEEVGADGYVTKPFQAQELLALMKTLLSAPKDNND